MSTWIADFERDCAAAEVSPLDVLREAGIHKAAWPRWKSGKVSPTLRKYDAARAALKRLSARKPALRDDAHGEAA